ncbi:MAG: hypothetical protein P4L45_02275, partial [Ignavibacteriaceae bacterium]|nr:hypothetical protein [Ignavibacteriaceae bacterium]
MSKSIRPDRKRILQIQFERKSEKFFNKRSAGKDEINELIIRAVKKLSGHNENIDLKQLQGEFKGYFRIRKNDLRIIFKVIEDENLI